MTLKRVVSIMRIRGALHFTELTIMWFLPNSRPADAPLMPSSRPLDQAAAASAGAEAADPKPVEAPMRMNYDESQMFYVLLIFFAAIALRLLLFFLGPYGDIERSMYPDSYRYVELGENLVGQGVFGLSSPETGVVHERLYELREELGQLEPVGDGGLRPEIMRTPGYPALLGATAWTGLGLYGLLIVQCLFSAVSVTLVYGIGRALLKRPGPALFAAAVVAVHPADIAAPSAVLTETYFTLLILLGIWSVADRERRGIGSASFGGLMIGLSVLVRPVSVLLGPAIALWMIATDRRLKTAFLSILMLALSLAPAAAWMARNEAVGFGYRLSSIPYINTYFYGNAYMRITEQGGDWERDWPKTVDTLMGELRAEQELVADSGGEADVFDSMNKLGVAAIKDDPVLYAQVLKGSSLKFFTDHSVGGLYQQLGLTYTPTGLREKLMTGGPTWENLSGGLKNPTGWIALTWTGLNVVMLVGMILGGVMLVVRRHWAALLLLGGVLIYFVIATQATGLERFRIPVLGVQALLAASLFSPRMPRPKKARAPKRRWYEREDGDEQEAKVGEGAITAIPEPESPARARPI